MAKANSTKMQPVVAEFVGTFVLALSILGISYLGVRSSFTIPAITIGLLVLVLGSVSGGHFNPAVTVGHYVAQKMKLDKAIMYLVAQVTGSLVALFTTVQLLDMERQDLLAETVGAPIFWAEVLGATIFTLAVAAAVHRKFDTLNAAVAVGGGLYIGLILASFTGVSGGVINPAVALSMGDVTSTPWQYLIAPLVGGALGFSLFRYLFTEKNKL